MAIARLAAQKCLLASYTRHRRCLCCRLRVPLIGRWVKDIEAKGLARRSDLVISTKIFWGGAMAGVKGNPNAAGLSRKHLLEGMKDSLQRLQLE